MALLAEIIGLVGVALILAAFFLLQTKKLDAELPRYSWMNFWGAVMVLVSLFWAWNLPAFVIETCWAAISAYKLWQIYRRPVKLN